jgi:Fe-S-cluster containining protein
MVSPNEIRPILAATGMKWDEVAGPFPEVIEYTDGSRITFEWCMKRKERQCIFLDKNRCAIYGNRPWICRTFPFMLEGNELVVSNCPGIGKEMDQASAERIAEKIFARAYEEAAESVKIRDLLGKQRIPDGNLVVIDGEDMKVLDG